jgi:hypothetical protein|tara:strand:- start:876 stop:1040 length:165 start_codon:yes stop_codon:yes gene_type:complete
MKSVAAQNFDGPGAGVVSVERRAKIGCLPAMDGHKIRVQTRFRHWQRRDLGISV